MTPLRKLLINFVALSKMDIGARGLNCFTFMKDNPRYPGASGLTDAVYKAWEPYQAAASVQHPTPIQTAALAQLRMVLNQALTAVAVMANGLFPDDEVALLSTGLELSKSRERHTTLEAPNKFQLLDGTQTGVLIAKARRPSHGVALKYLFTLDPSRPDIEWYVVVVRDGEAVFNHCKSGDRVYCKVAAVGGDTDQQPYSEVLSRMVQ